MIRLHNKHKRSLTIIVCWLCLLALVPVAATQAAVQRGKGEEQAAAEKLTAEAVRLAKEGTKEASQQALDKFLAAVPLYRAAGDRSAEADTLNSIGNLYNHFGDQQQALDYFAQALPLYHALGDRSGEAVELNNMGVVYQQLGELQKALDCFSRALPLLQAINERSGEATTLNNIGSLYFALGERQKALDYLTQALPVHHAANDPAAEAVTLTNIGDIYASADERQKALAHYERALPLYRAAGERRDEARLLNQIGRLYADADDLQKAVEYYTQALPISRAVGDRSGEASILSNVGAGFLAIGEQKEALKTYQQVLSLYQAIGDRSSAARTLFNIAFNARGTGDLDMALTNMEAALVLLESLRAGIGSQELRASYFAGVQDYYEFYIDLLMELHKRKPADGYAGRALQASERARARSLLETLAEAGADIRAGVEPALLERERALQQDLNAKGQAQIKLLSGAHTEAEAASLAKELEALTTEFQQVKTQIRQTSPRYAALTQPQPLSAQEIQRQVLDADTLLLEYALGRDRSYLWAVTADSIKSYELPKRVEIEAAARELYAVLTHAGRWSSGAPGNTDKRGLFPDTAPRNGTAAPGVPAAATRLAQMVLAPVAAQLAGKRLIVVADGALQFIPFAALPLPAASSSGGAAYRPLITEHEVVSLPSASTLAVLRREVQDRQPAAKTIAVLADPVFALTDARLTAVKGAPVRRAAVAAPTRPELRGLALALPKPAGASSPSGGGQIPRLPGTRQEAEQILALVPGASQMHVFDFAANRAAVTSPGLGAYRYVHLATHGFVDSQHPELSGIVLSMYDERGAPQDGFLRAHEVFNLKLPAELVTLSACQTGLGQEIKGEGLVSLARGFMYAGAPRVVVSLWSVSDEATAELMTHFYRGILVEKLRPAQALQRAQAAMLNDKRYSAPFYWAAFTLQGEWR